ncbi:nucleotide excision repair endonuclease [Bacillus sp. ISL-75]|uniref:nucleotide excision repair endonuclease n=1 Tax=Bacillus sp. ISL-75 TaxID=2819137 RepID=UPI001BE9F7BF|nr:nucleotide excision repair endonuclease [Bacillus sp. ISL-75]MBT2728375.1 nucleotide excision repair endonuclease [Bacillus sp. ISL-75]
MDLKNLIKITTLKKMKFQQWDHELYDPKTLAFNTEILNILKNKLGGGIYRMYNQAGEIIYVGKSNDIHRRLLQHIGKRSNTAYFIEEVKKIEFFVENSPIFQTMLEGIFIAYHTPKYNDEVQDAYEMILGRKNIEPL